MIRQEEPVKLLELRQDRDLELQIPNLKHQIGPERNIQMNSK